MKRLVAILIMLLLVVQTVQFAFCASYENYSVMISLDEDIESKENMKKKPEKEYGFSFFPAGQLAAGLHSFFDYYRNYFPASPWVKIPTPPPDFCC